jgi:hypothetical protein
MPEPAGAPYRFENGAEFKDATRSLDQVAALFCELVTLVQFSGGEWSLTEAGRRALSTETGPASSRAPERRDA